MSTASLFAPRPSAPPSPSRTLRSQCLAVRVQFTWFGVRRALELTQLSTIAEEFEAKPDRLAAAKKILDTRHSAYREVTKIKGCALNYWKLNSLPFPEPGIRLIPQSRMPHFEAQMVAFRDDLTAAVNELESHYSTLRSQARENLGLLFKASDYPESLIGCFGISWDFPNISAPNYLMELHPEVYEREQARIAAQFDEAVRLAEASFTEEFAGLVTHMCAVLSETDQSGNKKVFRDSTVTNLRDFITRFQALNVHSNPELDALVSQAQSALSGRGISAKSLRADDTMRAEVSEALGRVKDTLAGMTVAQPRRRIDRRNIPKVSREPQPCNS